ncbi:hypothetical protein F5887DRAFT_947818 [Amanita rubescens]|nr:hypothetical protein F5887DRAFT_947818 [Amanita rubescens]
MLELDAPPVPEPPEAQRRVSPPQQLEDWANATTSFFLALVHLLGSATNRSSSTRILRCHQEGYMGDRKYPLRMDTRRRHYHLCFWAWSVATVTYLILSY